MSKMKKRRNILLIVAGVLVSLFFYGKYNFQNDKQALLELKIKASNGEYFISDPSKPRNIHAPPSY